MCLPNLFGQPDSCDACGMSYAAAPYSPQFHSVGEMMSGPTTGAAIPAGATSPARQPHQSHQPYQSHQPAALPPAYEPPMVPYGPTEQAPSVPDLSPIIPNPPAQPYGAGAAAETPEVGYFRRASSIRQVAYETPAPQFVPLEKTYGAGKRK